jgi:hypothetical protein
MALVRDRSQALMNAAVNIQIPDEAASFFSFLKVALIREICCFTPLLLIFCPCFSSSFFSVCHSKLNESTVSETGHAVA